MDEMIATDCTTREGILAVYRPIRAGIREVLRNAAPACAKADLQRAARLLDLWENGAILIEEEGNSIDMLTDIALFEPNQRGRRVYDRFLMRRALQLPQSDLALAKRMAGAFFSLFRCVAKHDIAGVWLEDMLADDRRVWLMDESFETSARGGGEMFGMRLFDAGPFHAGFGIVAMADEETASFAVEGMRRHGRTPFRHSLAVTLYGDSLAPRFAPEIEEKMMMTLLDLIKPDVSEAALKHALPAPSQRRFRAA